MLVEETWETYSEYRQSELVALPEAVDCVLFVAQNICILRPMAL